jgi:AraC family transcriptional regulator
MNNQAKQQALTQRYHPVPRRDELLHVIAQQLDRSPIAETTASGAAMASAACLSRFHFQRVFRQTLGETPSHLRRRLLLERAAHELRSTNTPVTNVALDAGYRSLEGFGRAFKTRFRVAPSVYRRLARNVLVPTSASSLVHYHAAAKRVIALNANRKNTKKNTKRTLKPMNLTERLLLHDYEEKHQMLELARLLPDTALDAPLAFRHSVMPFIEPEKTLREVLERMVGDIWVLTLLEEIQWESTDTSYRTVTDNSVENMITRLGSYHTDFTAFVRKVEAENLWETEWVDRACEPVETFTYGQVIEGVLTWGIPQRMKARQCLNQLGLELHYP